MNTSSQILEFCDSIPAEFTKIFRLSIKTKTGYASAPFEKRVTYLTIFEKRDCMFVRASTILNDVFLSFEGSEVLKQFGVAKESGKLSKELKSKGSLKVSMKNT